MQTAPNTNHGTPPRRRRKPVKRVGWQQISTYALVFIVVMTGLIVIVKSLSSKEDKQHQAEPLSSLAQTRPTAPEGYQLLTMTASDLASGDLILVNADYGYDASMAPELVNVYENKSEHYYLRTEDLELSRRALTALNNWMEGFYAHTKVFTLNVVAGYRTEEYQQDLRDNAIENKGISHANNYIALPGHSEHHTGLAIDLDSYDADTGASGGFDGTGIYQWAVDHAWEYGFVQRYPLDKENITGISYEEWHFRYVGLPHSQVMSEKKLCLEEYITYLKQYPFDGEHLCVRSGDGDYEIYYCPGMDVAVPQGGTYDISGNNVDGFIVTVRLN